jgi:hypothetical protein
LLDKAVFRGLKSHAFSAGYSWQPFCLVDNRCSSPYGNVRSSELTNSMFPAQKQDTPPADATASAAGGFGKVLNSIQGLQQRLDDFSVEDVSRAQSKAENLIRELSLLQLKLNGLAITEQVLTDARRTIVSIPENNFDLVDFDTLEKYPTLHLLVKASTLVELVRVRAQAFANYIDELNAARESAEAITVNFEPQGSKASASPFPQLGASAAFEAGGGENATAELLVPRVQLDELPAQKPGPEKGGRHSQSASLLDQPHGGSDKKKTTAAKSGFNQRLLDDLIDTYGDFASSPNLPALLKATKPVMPKASEYEPFAAHSVKREDVTLPAVLPEAVRVKVGTAKPVPTKITQDEIIFPPAVEHPRPTKQNEIDRQLKNIIKDYGEYDLYQRHSSLNLKVVGILTFAFLLLVLGGLYFFRSRAPVASVPASSAWQSNVQSSSSSPGSEGAGTNSAGRASSRNVTSNPGAAETLSDPAINTKQKK